MEDLVSAQWLEDRLGEPGLIVIDATAHVLEPQRDAQAEFAAGHIPGAKFLDLASLYDPDSPVPAALPTGAQFAQRTRALGIGPKDRIVLYDDSPARTSARAWFIARLHGSQAAILDGGLAQWRAEGLPLERGGGEAGAAGPSNSASGLEDAPGITQVRSKADMLNNLATGAEQVLDARGPGRFSGREPEPRPEMGSGHIPGAHNLPYGKVLNPDGTFKRGQALRTAFEEAGIDLTQPVVTTCGSGVTAAVLLFALHLLGKGDTALYDGSWSEWAVDPATPKATGDAG